MTITSRVKKIYERRPYPPVHLRTAERWTLPPVDWIEAMREDPRPLRPKRVFVAGCGVGSEAFALAQKFPEAEVVAVDFSERSIREAKRLQRGIDGGSRIRFDVADLSSPTLLGIAGGRFEFISCHGVLSYIPDVAGVFRNFAKLLALDGVLILGLNGSSHPSRRFRRVLTDFGFDINEYREPDRARSVLEVCDLLSTYPPAQVAKLPDGYLAGDMFGPLNHALPLDEWNRFMTRERLHLRASYHAFMVTRGVVNAELHPVLKPRKRAENALLFDIVAPASFHHLLVTRRPAVEAEWTDPRKLLRLHPMRTWLYKVRWPRGRKRPNVLRPLSLKAESVSTGVTLSVPQWEVDLLRNADGITPLSDLLPARVDRTEAANALYLLYLLGALNFLPKPT